MSSITIRLAEDYDNDKIIALAQKCPQKGMITFFVNRTPRFNSLHRLLDPGSWHYVACKGDQIIGLVGVMHFKGKVLGKDCKIGFMLDLRLLEEYRNGLTAFRMVKAAVDHIRQSDADMVIVNFLKGNKDPRTFTSGKGGLPAAHYLGENAFFNLLPLHRMKLDKRFKIEPLAKEDIPELIELYNMYAKGFRIAPVFTEDRFRSYLNSLDGLSMDKFLVARENGKIKAVTAIWDEHTYKSYQVLKLNFTLNVVTRLLKFLSFFIKGPKPVKINEPLRQLSLVMYAHDDCPEALDTLFRHVNNTHRGSEYTLITIYAQVKDPIFRFVEKYKGLKVQSEMYIFARDPAIFEKLDESPLPVLFDMTMIQ